MLNHRGYNWRSSTSVAWTSAGNQEISLSSVVGWHIHSDPENCGSILLAILYIIRHAKDCDAWIPRKESSGGRSSQTWHERQVASDAPFDWGVAEYQELSWEFNMLRVMMMIAAAAFTVVCCIYYQNEISGGWEEAGTGEQLVPSSIKEVRIISLLCTFDFVVELNPTTPPTGFEE